VNALGHVGLFLHLCFTSKAKLNEIEIELDNESKN